MTLKAGHKSVCLQCARFFSFIWMRVVVREGKHILKDKKGIPYNVNSSYSGWYIMGEFCFSLNSMYFSNLLQWTCLIEWFLTSFSFLRQRDTSWGSYRDSEQVGSGLCGPVGLSPLLSIAAVLIHTPSLLLHSFVHSTCHYLIFFHLFSGLFTGMSLPTRIQAPWVQGPSFPLSPQQLDQHLTPARCSINIVCWITKKINNS